LFTTMLSANTHIPSQGNYKWRNDDGNLENATDRNAENNNSDIGKNMNIRLRVEIYSELDPQTFPSLDLYYSRIGIEEWMPITNDPYGQFQLSLSSYFDEADTINDILTNSGGYPHDGGFTIESTTAKSFYFYGEKSYEFEYCFKATSYAHYDSTYEFTVRDTDTSYTFSYSLNPELTIIFPLSLDLQNITIGNNQTECYDASQTITVAGGGTDFTVQSGGDATLIAGQNIFLMDGTMIHAGSNMTAHITSNGIYCGSEDPVILSIQEEEKPKGNIEN